MHNLRGRLIADDFYLFTKEQLILMLIYMYIVNGYWLAIFISTFMYIYIVIMDAAQIRMGRWNNILHNVLNLRKCLLIVIINTVTEQTRDLCRQIDTHAHT